MQGLHGGSAGHQGTDDGALIGIDPGYTPHRLLQIHSAVFDLFRAATKSEPETPPNRTTQNAKNRPTTKMAIVTAKAIPARVMRMGFMLGSVLQKNPCALAGRKSPHDH